MVSFLFSGRSEQKSMFRDKTIKLTKLKWLKFQVQILYSTLTNQQGHGFPCWELQWESRQKLAVDLLTPL